MMLEYGFSVSSRQYLQVSGQLDNERKMHQFQKRYKVEWKEDVLGSAPSTGGGHIKQEHTRHRSRRRSRKRPRSPSQDCSKHAYRPPDKPRMLSFEDLMSRKPTSRSHFINEIRRHNDFCLAYFREINAFHSQRTIVR